MAETLAYLNINHPDYAILASRVVVKNLHKKTYSDLLAYAKNITNFTDPAGRVCNLLNEETLKVFIDHHKEL